MSESNGAGKTEVELDIDEWIVVAGQNGQQYLGRQYLHPGANRINTLIRSIEDGTPIILRPAFEFATPTSRSGDGKLSRAAFAFPVGLIYQGAPVYVKPAMAYACVEMSEADKAAYEKLARAGIEAAQQMSKARADVTEGAARSPLVIG